MKKFYSSKALLKMAGWWDAFPTSPPLLDPPLEIPRCSLYLCSKFHFMIGRAIIFRFVRSQNARR